MKRTSLKHLKIGYQRVTVHLVDKEDRGHDGSYDAKNHKIFIIDAGQNRVEDANTLIHECLHALWETQGLKESAGAVANRDLEETVINALSNGLTQIFRDNPLIFPWLKERLND